MSLRIQLTVKRCPHAHTGRVRFVLGHVCRPGEAVVLRRWRDRSSEARPKAADETFDGCRLPPGSWFLLNACAAVGLRLDVPIESAVLRLFLDDARREHPTWRAPQVDKFARVIEFLRQRKVLRQVLERTRDPDNPGLPDLFLWRRDRDGAINGGQFVEVKRHVRLMRWKEPLSKAQKQELEFLRGLDLKAHAVYLIE